jgi:hypothetical protein
VQPGLLQQICDVRVVRLSAVCVGHVRSRVWGLTVPVVPTVLLVCARGEQPRAVRVRQQLRARAEWGARDVRRRACQELYLQGTLLQ